MSEVNDRVKTSGQATINVPSITRTSLSERCDAVNVIHQLLADAGLRPLVAGSIVLAAAGVAEQALTRLIEDGALASELESGRSLLKDSQSAVDAITASEYYFEIFLRAEYLLLLQYGVTAGAALELVQRGWALRHVVETGDSISTRAVRDEARNLRDHLALAKAREIRDQDDVRTLKDKIRRAGLMVGGALIVGVNTFIGTVYAPVTGGLSSAGIAVSAALGGTLMGKSLESGKATEGRPLVLNFNLPPEKSLGEVIF